MIKSQQKTDLVATYDEIASIFDTADRERRDITEIEEATLHELFSKFDSIDGKLQLHDQFDQLQESMAKGQGRKSEPNEIYNQPFSRDADLYGGQLSRGRQAELVQSQLKPFQGRRAADLFNRATINNMGGFRSGAEFFQCVAQGLHHPGLILNSTMTEGTGADGGFTVPSQLIARIFDESLETEIIRPRANVFPMASSDLSIAGIDYTNHSANIGGLDMVWLAEGATATAQKGKFRMITLKAKKGAVFTEASSELIFDSPTFERQMIQAMAASVGFGFDEAFLRGSGAGQPLGILNCPSTISIPRESGQAADTLVYENIVNMWARLAPSLWSNAIWICNSDALPQLLTMAFPMPSGSTAAQPLFLPSQSIAEQHAGTIFGRPLFFSEKCSTIGDAGDLILCNPMQYAIGLRLDAAFDRSIHPGFMRDVQSFRLITRADGYPLMNSAITPRNGTNTLSWAVVIDSRS